VLARARARGDGPPSFALRPSPSALCPQPSTLSTQPLAPSMQMNTLLRVLTNVLMGEDEGPHSMRSRLTSSLSLNTKDRMSLARVCALCWHVSA